MSIEPTKQAALESILSNREMLRAVELEPAILTILEIAASPEPRTNRWVSYEALKRMARPYVGFDARQEELQTCQHYELLIDAIDRLLPDNEIGEIA